MVPVKHPADSDSDQEIVYFNFLTSLLSQYTGYLKETDIDAPTMKIQYVSPVGLLRIAFSEKFIVPQNITVLKDVYFADDG